MKKKPRVFNLECPYVDCTQRKFMITRTPVDSATEEIVEEVIECPYCHRKSTYPIPAHFAEPDVFIRNFNTGDTIKGIR